MPGLIIPASEQNPIAGWAIKGEFTLATAKALFDVKVHWEENEDSWLDHFTRASLQSRHLFDPLSASADTITFIQHIKNLMNNIELINWVSVQVFLYKHALLIDKRRQVFKKLIENEKFVFGKLIL